MPIIREDELGLFCYSRGWVIRPYVATSFSKDDRPGAKHHAGTMIFSIGDELWLACGLSSESKTPEQRKEERDHAFKYAGFLVEFNHLLHNLKDTDRNHDS